MSNPKNKDVNRIYRFINKDNLDFIINNLGSEKIEYIENLCICIDALANISGINTVCDNFVKDFKNGNTDINRCFVQLLLAYKFKRLGILSELESGTPPLDFLLTNGLGAELTRIGDDNHLIEAKIRNFISTCDLHNYKDFEIEIRLKSNQIKSILSSLKRDFNLLLEKKGISNKIYDILLYPRNNDFTEMSVLPNTGKIFCISNEGAYSLKIEFVKNAPDILESILNKNTRTASKKSYILIVDLSNESSSYFSLDSIRNKFDEIKNEIPSNNLAIIIAVRFFFESAVIKCKMTYLIRGREDERILNFENIFLKNNSL